MDIMLHMIALDIEIRTWIQHEAQRTGASVETVVERLIQRGVMAERQAARAQRFHDLDGLAGTWSSEEAEKLSEKSPPPSQPPPDGGRSRTPSPIGGGLGRGNRGICDLFRQLLRK